ATSKAVAVQDRMVALASMRAIGHVPDLIYARVETLDHRVLAAIGAATRLDSDVRLSAGDTSISPLSLLASRSVEVSVPVINGGQEVGRFVLLGDTSDLMHRLLTSLLITTAGAGGALVVGLMVAGRMRRSIARPLERLTETIGMIRESHDY